MANNLMMVRHRLLTELIKLWKNEKLTTEDIDRLKKFRANPSDESWITG